MKIMFLDFDGVISTNRAWLAQKHIDHHDLRWLDPIACKMVKELCEKFGYTIVVTSTWRNFGMERVAACMGMHGLWNLTHSDWRTKEIWEHGSKATRPYEIIDWLDRQRGFGEPVTDYIIVDDDGFDWTDEQAARWIRTDTTNGISTENYEAICNLNGE